MKMITLIKAEIMSLSPLFISDGEEEILMDNESGMAYLPATSIAGSFRAYLKSIDENYKELFGVQNKESSMMSSVYISDAFAKIHRLERRDGVRIDSETGSHVYGAKIERLYLGDGIKFQLVFEIHSQRNKNQEFKQMLYKCLKALDKGFIRFGGNKSNGLGNFEIVKTEEIEFNLENKEEWLSYLKKDYAKGRDIKAGIENSYIDDIYVEFIIKGKLTSPLLIKSSETYDPEDVDDKSIKSGEKYIIPGSSFKGVLRHRVETIANYFGSINEAREMFGTIQSEKEKHILSRVFVSESVIDNKEFYEERQYNRIKIDRFTGGVINTALMNDIPVQGTTEFKIIYKKQNNESKDNYAIGIIALALRDLGTENLSLGSGNSIGRGRFRANAMSIAHGENRIDINFDNKTISDQVALNKYVEAIKNSKGREGTK